MKAGRRPRFKTLVGAGLTALCFGIALYGFLYPGNARAGGRLFEERSSGDSTAQSKFSTFTHDIPAHKNKDCSDCHKFPSSNWEKVRPESDAFPDITDYPKHDSCVGCHRQQFYSGAKPAICSICHVNPSPRDSRRHPFPNPSEAFDQSDKGKRSFTEFAVGFPHEMHIAMLASNHSPAPDPNKVLFLKAGFRRAVQSDTCAMCHQLVLPQGDSDDEYVTKPPEQLGDLFWLKKGTFMSQPPGHTQCFTCHSADAGLNPSPSNCGTCHKLQPKGVATDFSADVAKTNGIDEKLLIASWRKRTSSATFRHEWFSHSEMECTACHSIADLMPADPKVKAVSITACSNCHITATSDDGGILNYEIDSRNKDPKFQCVKCHIGYGVLPVPASHPAAIKALAGGK